MPPISPLNSQFLARFYFVHDKTIIQDKPRQKTFPGCTIRNTPSEPIHCIVWAKFLFGQLFGEPDDEQQVSPDAADPELANGEESENKGKLRMVKNQQ